MQATTSISKITKIVLSILALSVFLNASTLNANAMNKKVSNKIIEQNTTGLVNISTEFFNDNVELYKLPIASCSSNKAYGYTEIVIPNNIAEYEACISYIFAVSNNNVGYYIDNYDYSGVYGNKKEYIKTMKNVLDEIADWHGTECKTYIDNESTYLFSTEYDDYKIINIYLCNDDIIISYEILYDYNNKKELTEVKEFLDKLNINITL